jgi:hypothetical protein
MQKQHGKSAAVVSMSELVLPFDVNAHLINPTIPTQDPPVPLPSSGMKKQQPQQRVPWMLTPAVPKQLLSSGAGLHQQ